MKGAGTVAAISGPDGVAPETAGTEAPETAGTRAPETAGTRARRPAGTGAPETAGTRARGPGGSRARPVVEDRSTRKRRAIVEAATALFLQRGYLGTSMDQITALAAVSKPTVYKFFSDKEQLFTEIVLETLDRAGDPFRAELASLARSDDLAADLPQLARHYLATVTQPAVLQLRRQVIGASPQLPGVARAYYERAPEKTVRALADCFQRLAERDLLRPCDPAVAASHFAFLVIGRVLDKSLFYLDRPFSDAELAAQADAGASAFLAAYATA
jgi:TetR/AcrR family transcriptional regulator, mexJK operon transcriptional repressor